MGDRYVELSGHGRSRVLLRLGRALSVVDAEAVIGTQPCGETGAVESAGQEQQLGHEAPPACAWVIAAQAAR